MGRLTLLSDAVTVDIDMVKNILRKLGDTTWKLTAEDELRWDGLKEILQDISDDYDQWKSEQEEDERKERVSNLPPDEKIVEIKCGCIILITDENYEAPDPESEYEGAMFGKVIKRCTRKDTPDTLIVYRDQIVDWEASV